MFSAQQKEQFSKAFIHAVATVAHCKISSCEVDDDSIDLELIGPRDLGPRKSPHLGVQLKCTHTDTGEGDRFSYQIKAKNYDDLRDPQQHVPPILVVLAVPSALVDWLAEKPEETAMRRIAYWTSLRGLPPSSAERPTVQLLRSNRFCVSSLTSIMTTIANNGRP